MLLRIFIPIISISLLVDLSSGVNIQKRKLCVKGISHYCVSKIEMSPLTAKSEAVTELEVMGLIEAGKITLKEGVAVLGSNLYGLLPK